MSLSAVRCPACGGSVVAAAGKELAECMFCGNEVALEIVEVDEDIEPPEGMIAFVVSAAQAQESFVTFARSSFWYPSDLRNASLELRRLLLPAWAFSGELETHWTGLVPASTRSGKRPVAGAERTRLDQVLVPASSALTLAELSKLGRFDESKLTSFSPASAECPFEVSEMTRSAGRQTAVSEMERRHLAAITSAQNLSRSRGASLILDVQGRPVLVPVFIGAYRYKDRVFRVLVNGESGQLIGDAPTSWLKVAGVAAAVLLAVLVLLGALSCCSGGALVAGS